jgi:hypothetical protein
MFGTQRWTTVAPVVLALLVGGVAEAGDSQNSKKCCSDRKLACKHAPVPSDLSLCGQDIAADPNHVRFAVIGDYGEGKSPCEAQVAKMIEGWDKKQRLNFIMTVGDNNYDEGAEDTIQRNIGSIWGSYVQERRFYPALGNHDWETTKKGCPYAWGTPYPYLDYFSYLAPLSPASDPPVQGRYYQASPHPLVDLFALDSDYREQDGTCCDSKQAAWLKGALGASKAPWKLVFFHHPPYSTAKVDLPGVWMRWPYKDWCATAVLSGHEHVYERLNIDNIPYFVNGLGGHPWLYEINACKPEPGSQARYNGAHGAMLVVANAKQMEFCLYSVKSAKPIDKFRQDLPPAGCTPPAGGCTPTPDLASYCKMQPPDEEPDDPACPAGSY